MKPEDITLRDYFAAHAPLDHTMLNNPKSVVDGLLTLARSSYTYADAMLIARQQPSPYEETSTPEVKPSPVESQEPQIEKPEISENPAKPDPQWFSTPGTRRSYDEPLIIRGVGLFGVSKRLGAKGFFLYLNHELLDGPFTTAEHAKLIAREEVTRRLGP